MNEPLNEKVPPVLAETELTPELAQATLTLHGDYYSQLQGKCNRYVFSHPICTTFLVVSSGIFLFYRLNDFITVSDTVGEFISFFIKSRDFQYQAFAILPFFVCIFGLTAVIAHFVSDVYKHISVELPKAKYTEELFGFNLRQFATLSASQLLKAKRKLTHKEKVFLEGGANTRIVLYRESPIAVITLRPSLSESTEKEFVVRITGLHVRKAFAKVDFDVLLLEWCYKRVRTLLQEYASKNPSNPDSLITILADAYSFDKAAIRTLETQSFRKVSSSSILNKFEYDPKSEEGISYITTTGAYNLFGISRDTYSLTLQGNPTK